MSKQEKSLQMTILMTPDMANFSGNVHGGSILKLLDQVAYACAARYCKSYVVTKSLDQVTFRAPIKVGELVTFRAHVNYVGNSSLEVGVKVFSESLQNHTVRHTNSCYVNMVAVGEDAKPVRAPELELEDEFEKKLFEAAVMRKELREEAVKRNREITADIPDYNTDLNID
ncbi:MAG: acyl-CoA thioesterase [Proteobacteria bacterium]|nr:acyl-CoA thioesterase [Pseudomonadota bacterium]NOG61332.1 acyl-CoA thioesterase [Pseudomonadota bacterium]